MFRRGQSGPGPGPQGAGGPWRGKMPHTTHARARGRARERDRKEYFPASEAPEDSWTPVGAVTRPWSHAQVRTDAPCPGRHPLHTQTRAPPTHLGDPGARPALRAQRQVPRRADSPGAGTGSGAGPAGAGRWRAFPAGHTGRPAPGEGRVHGPGTRGPDVHGAEDQAEPPARPRRGCARRLRRAPGCGW